MPAATDAPVLVMTRAVNAEALNPCSAVSPRYVSTARVCAGCGAWPKADLR